MLTPAKDDPNYKAEVKRLAEQPDTFGQEAEKPQVVADTRDFSTSGLVADRDATADDQGDDSWQVYLDQSVAAITMQLPDLEVFQLEELREAEKQGKNRVSLLDAVSKELTSRES